MIKDTPFPKLDENSKHILDVIENGIFITDCDLTIQFWNSWLVINTGIEKKVAQNKTLEELFPAASFKLLKRKVKVALKLKSSTFTNSTVDKYVIPIKLKRITKSFFKHMRQDVVITPLDDNKVSVIIYDTSPLLEAKSIINNQLDLVQKQATTDALTGCYNRKMFNDILDAETSRAIRHELTFSLIIFDVDNFKSVNDTYGHLAGDEVLKALASIANNYNRASDVFARWGGEEFTVLLPETELEGAAIVAEKLRKVIAAHDCGKPGHITCSFGVAEFSMKEDTNLLITNADKALYFAKNNGKNQVGIWDQNKLTQYSSTHSI